MEEYLRKFGLNERQIKAVMYVKERGRITNKEYRSMFDITDRTALSDLNNLCERGFLRKIGITGRSAAYELTRNKPEINPKFEKLVCLVSLMSGGWRVSRIVSLKKELKDFCYFCSKDKVRCGLINLVRIYFAERSSK